MKTLLINIILVFATTTICTAQGGYNDFMQRMTTRGPQLKALTATRIADSLGLRRGLNPADPSADVDYLFGKEKSLELTVSQSFDFPTVYHQRNKIAAHGIEKVDAQYMASRRKLLLEASDLYLSLGYYNQLRTLYAERARDFRRLDSAARISLQSGEITALEHGKITIMLQTAQNQLIEVTSQRSQAIESLRQLGADDLDPDQVDMQGDFQLGIDPARYVNVVMSHDWDLRSAELDSLIAGRSLKLARSEWAPGLKIGYKMVLDGSTARNGIVGGITIPLWQNRNNVKHSKAMIAASAANLRVAESNLRSYLTNLFDRYTASQAAMQGYAQMNMTQYRNMLRRSLDSGVITMMDYLLELTTTQETEQQALAARYQYAITAGEAWTYLRY